MSKPVNKLKNLIESLKGLFSTIGWCLRLSWSTSKFYTIVRVSSEITAPLLTISSAYIGKYIIDILARELSVASPVRMMLPLFALLLVSVLLVVSLQRIRQYCQSMHEDLLSSKMSVFLMTHALDADLELFDNTEYYDKLQSAGQGSYAMSGILWSAISCISSVVTFAVAFAALSSSNVLYGMCLLIAAIPSAFTSVRYTKLVYRLSLDQINGQREMSYYHGVAMQKAYAQDVRLFNAGEWLKKRYTAKWQSLFDSRRVLTRKRAVITCVIDFIPEIICILIGVDIAGKILNGVGTVGDYSFYTGLTAQLMSAVSVLSMAMMQIYDNQLKIDNYRGLSAFKNNIEDTGTTPLGDVETVNFENVSFTYPGTSAPVLDDVSFTVGPDERVAIVGLNGSGKSTIIKLLLRMYDVNAGRILVNGVDIRGYPVDMLRSKFSVYFQDMHNYCFTLRDNMLIADEQAENTDEAAEAAFAASDGESILNKSSMRLDVALTKLLDPEGIELSGGEHQKVALARTFFRRHSALILDEPSSNLDPEAEDRIFKSIEKLTKGKLTIFTSHRLSNVALSDRVIVLEEGKIVEIGTQEELLKNKRRYAELFHYQQEKYMLKESDNQNVNRDC